ncbi:MAG: DNA ligase D [Gemmatimonadales bacterium]|nr:DNA ligase D [Gemmatimonadales bacterium]NIN12526.1 DNA ligase D [Gemmatimonadales bacterium]NIN50897.1 DNA ligase D [Gemmatimonadales bacterium]NIP08361.1 DNA ligase D [Gemmatimonadales bacterium]NIR03458.1 DNA ligase D [Gemmatimonadales bacterium]
MAKAKKPDRLSAYRAKRAVERSPEPAGTIAERPGRLFVVHKHAARQLHFDLRLEMGGVLESWAVPKGPSRNPKDKRLAVKVEDHPIEYGDFEGVIPEGNYGAGAVILWDRGVWVPAGDVEEGLEKGKLLFELRGYKLRGAWTLVKIKKSEKDWLLIKERDGLVSTNGDEFPQDSILSGLTVEQLKEGKDPGKDLRAELKKAKARRRRVDLASVDLMLAESRERPFSRPGWVFEIKYDGYRILAGLGDAEAQLLTRNGNDATATFPEIARAVSALPFGNLVLDGEVVVHDESGLPSFQRLQKRGRLTRAVEVRRAAAEHPATLYVFDLLGFEGHDLRAMPLSKRKTLLRRVLPTVGPLRYSDHIEERGEEFFEHVGKLGLEGMIGKKADAPYRGGRSPQWLKVRADKTADLVVVGFTTPKGSRGGFGALHLGGYEQGELVYAGRVGSGFTSKQLDEIRSALDGIRLDGAPCTRAPAGKSHLWVQPELVCEVRYREWTEDGLLRHPVFLRFRDDKPAQECVLPGGGRREEVLPDLSLGPPPSSLLPDLQLTNLDKVFWPEERYTKGDLIEYYRGIAPWMLPYLQDRPLVMTRYPDGIDGKSFFQKDAPGFAPDWVRRERMWTEDSERELSYFIADDEASLLYIINLGSIPLHVWASRISSLERPDWCILDLDPKDAPFAHVVTIARALHQLCEGLELPNFVKTSGASGLHVLVPLARQCTYEQSRVLGELLARVVVAELPEIATIARVPAQREGRVYVDYLQNGHGKLLVAPFCVRPIPGAPVSMPLRWREVNSKLLPGRYTICNAGARMKRLGEDPLRPVLEHKPDLESVLGRLQERL